MSDQPALLAAIRANPDDDTPRLIYADWLDEHLPDAKPSPAASPSARADYIRVQCRLAHRPYDDPEYPALLERENELALWLAAHAPDDALPDLPDELESYGSYSSGDDRNYRRGFPDEMEFSDFGEDMDENVDVVAGALPEAFARTTARTLRLIDVYGAEIAGLVERPEAAGLRGLLVDYVADDEESAAVQAIAKAKHLAGLRRLALELSVEPGDLAKLAKAPHLESLEEFEIDQLTPDGARALAAGKWFRNLRALNLWANHRDTFKAVAEMPAMPNLVSLTVRGSVAPAALVVRKLAASRAFPRLAYLSLENTQLTPEQVVHLARGPWPLRHLRLNGVEVRKAGAEALAGAAFAGTLRVLELWDAKITASGVQALAGCAALAGLQHLDLTSNPIGPGGLLALARSTHLRGLRAIHLRRCNTTKAPVDAATVLSFLNELNAPDLRQLTLDSLPVGIRGAKVLAAGGAFANLRSLELTGCALREKGARAVAESAALPHLTVLDLAANNAGKGVAKLAGPKVHPRLGHCNLTGNRVPKAALGKLNKRPGVKV